MIKTFNKYFLAMLVMAFAATTFSFADDTKVVWFKSNPHCESCVKKIETAYNKIDGVEKSHVCLDAKAVKLTYHPEKTNEASLKQTLLDLGYKAELGSEADCCKASGKKAEGEAHECKDGETKTVKTANVKKDGCCSKDAKASVKSSCDVNKKPNEIKAEGNK